MNAVQPVGANQAWAVGLDGVILHSSDGGRTWFHQESGVSNSLEGVFFVDADTGWAVGEKGVILHTGNGGSSWEVQSSNTTASLHALWFVDAQRGWVGLPDGVLRTTDGGQTWAKVGDLPSEANSLQFFDANTGVVVCSSSSPLGGKIMRTSDGGATWTAATCQSIWLPPGPCQNNFTALHFPTSSFGCAVGGWVGPLAYTTESGGTTWTEQKTNIDFGVADSVFFLDTNKGWATVQQSIPATSALLLTADGGRNWSKVESGLNIRDLAFMSADEGLVAASVGVRRSTDGGLTWSPPEPFAIGGAYKFIGEISFVDASEGWAVGSRSPSGGRILHTADGGQTWQTQFETDQSLNAVHFVNAQRGWAVGSSGVILATSNGGSTWNYQTAATSSYGLHDVYFVDENYGWIAGDYWDPIFYMHRRSWRTTDGGAHWTQAGSFPGSGGSGEYAVHFVSRTLGYVAGASGSGYGSVWKTTDGGDTWVEKPLGGDYGTLLSLSFINANEGWAVGGGGIIAHTTNGGDSWELQAGGTGATLYDVAFLDTQRGYAVGAGIALKTTNGGQTWNKEQVTNTEFSTYYSVAFPDPYHAWVAGEGGISSYTDPLAPPPPELREHVYLPLVLK